LFRAQGRGDSRDKLQADMSGNTTHRPTKVLGNKGQRNTDTVRKNPGEVRVKQYHVRRSVQARCPRTGFGSMLATRRRPGAEAGPAHSSTGAALPADFSPQHWLAEGPGPGADSPQEPRGAALPVRQPLPPAISPDEAAPPPPALFP